MILCVFSNVCDEDSKGNANDIRARIHLALKVFSSRSRVRILLSFGATRTGNYDLRDEKFRMNRMEAIEGTVQRAI